jgi:hypothetical protein
MATNTRRNRSISASSLAVSNTSMSEFDAKALGFRNLNLTESDPRELLPPKPSTDA